MTLIQNEAAFVARLSDNDRRQAENERQHLENERLHLQFQQEARDRFARIESQMAEIIRVLADHGRRIDRLTDAVRDRIGFKGNE